MGHALAAPTCALTRGREDTAARRACEVGSRVLQVAVSIAGLIAMLPVMAVIAAAIKAVSHGPVFYRGTRVGKGEKLFTIFKFRTLHVGAEEKIGSRLLTGDDPFHHRFGKFLKQSKLDEVPQLWNVIRGDMNLVGPRPIRPVFLAEFTAAIPDYSLRFSVRPGMTGLAQLRGGYYTTVSNKLRYDLLYAKRRSLRLDLAILALTFVKLLKRWITAASLLCLIVLFVSLVPAGVTSSFSLTLLGVQFNPIMPLLLAAGAYLVFSAGKSNRWLVSHSAIDAPMVAFVLLSALAMPFSIRPITALCGLIYLCITGFLFTFVLVNLRPDASFARRAAQVVCVAGAGVALVSIGETVGAKLGLVSGPTAQAVSTLGSPAGLTAYLALCFPLVLCEYFEARTYNVRLLWVAAGVAIAGAVATAGGRLGVPALLVGAGVLLVKTNKLSLKNAVIAAGVCLLVLSVLAGGRYSLRAVAGDTHAAVRAAVISIHESSFQQLLIGLGTKTLQSSASVFAWQHGLPQSTYLTLLLENGVGGFCLMTWLAALVLREISISARNQPESIRIRLWSLAAAICGIAVAAVSFNIFYSIATQFVFWGIVGLALGLSVRYGGKDHGAVLVMRFGH